MRSQDWRATRRGSPAPKSSAASRRCAPRPTPSPSCGSNTSSTRAWRRAWECVSRISAVIDIGANLTHSTFHDDVAEVVARARDAGVHSIIVTGTTVEESRAAAALAEKHSLWATTGVHPHHARDCGPATIASLREISANPRVVAIGECGLDFNRSYSPHPDQEK